ncbi:MAG: hypothetical protein KAI41_07280 [Hyphomicrobiaceae bacterium]|nr:hypothetical protein [Hyphomicrobiaceae bacterium]MCK5550317.1 hypothetical protein [Hyphomicrobiaceae bacterium]
MPHTIKVEDGTGLVDANSYVSLADAESYIEATGRQKNPAWLAAGTAEKNSALINATQYMDTTYLCRYLGERAEATIDTQALEFPRDGLFAPSGAAIPSADIPPEIANACAEFALVDVAGEIQPDPVPVDDSGRTVTFKRVRVEGAVEKETRYTGASNANTRRKYPRAERVLRKWLRPVSRLLLRA